MLVIHMRLNSNIRDGNGATRGSSESETQGRVCTKKNRPSLISVSRVKKNCIRTRRSRDLRRVKEEAQPMLGRPQSPLDARPQWTSSSLRCGRCAAATATSASRCLCFRVSVCFARHSERRRTLRLYQASLSDAEANIVSIVFAKASLLDTLVDRFSCIGLWSTEIAEVTATWYGTGYFVIDGLT